jgi:hypothetical protein
MPAAGHQYIGNELKLFQGWAITRLKLLMFVMSLISVETPAADASLLETHLKGWFKIRKTKTLFCTNLVHRTRLGLNTAGSGRAWAWHVRLRFFAGLGTCKFLCSKIGLGLEVRPTGPSPKPRPGRARACALPSPKIKAVRWYTIIFMHYRYALYLLRRLILCHFIFLPFVDK